jgi:hypothetical protein
MRVTSGFALVRGEKPGNPGLLFDSHSRNLLTGGRRHGDFSKKWESPTVGSKFDPKYLTF